MRADGRRAIMLDVAVPSARSDAEAGDPWQRTKFGLAAMAMLLASGTVVYRILGLGWVDAYYQTVITVSTVGYSEVGGETTTTTAYRLVSSVVILFGVGIAAYTIGVAFDGLMEGRLRESLGRTRMRRELDNLEHHIVVCGWGQVGQAISRSVVAQGRHAVVIDRQDGLSSPGCHFVAGDATDDDNLRLAGIARADGLVVALDSDADNLWVTLSARAINPGLFIVARSNGPDAGPKLLQAGADRVVNPHQIGGTRMASLMMQPNVADFLGEFMNDREFEIRLAESPVTASSRVAGQTLGDSALAPSTGVTVLAIRRTDGAFVQNPDPSQSLEAGDVLITLGTTGQQDALEAWLDGQ